MKIQENEYSFQDFIDKLCEAEIGAYQRFKVIGYLTNFTIWGEQNRRYDLSRIFQNRGIEIRKWGEIRWLRGHFWDRDLDKEMPAEFYTYLYPETGLLLCFTDEKTEAVRQIIGKQVVDIISGIYYLFIRPEAFDRLSEKITQDYPLSRCTSFWARHLSQFRMRGETRPEIYRRMRYIGDDALEVLNEVRQFYGVIPTQMQFKIPEMGTYDFNDEGFFTLVSSEVMESSRRYLLELTDFLLKDVLVYRQIVETADFKLIPIQTQKKIFHIPKIIPWTVTFSQQLEFNDGKTLLQVLSENDYSVFNHVINEGSLVSSGMITDENKKNLLTFDLNNNRMVVAPIGEVSFDIFLRLYRTILEQFDSKAKCETYKV